MNCIYLTPRENLEEQNKQYSGLYLLYSVRKILLTLSLGSESIKHIYLFS